jgi:hypothetical protein
VREVLREVSLVISVWPPPDGVSSAVAMEASMTRVTARSAPATRYDVAMRIMRVPYSVIVLRRSPADLLKATDPTMGIGSATTWVRWTPRSATEG